MPADRYTERVAVLESARDAVTKSRNATYGPPTQDFDRTAAILNVIFAHKLAHGEQFTASDVAKTQIAVKLSRLVWTPTHQDSWTDIAGYAACGYECATSERRTP